MDYIALYRKYRPQSFEELVGQEAVSATLAKAVATGNTVHAYLFCGPRGTGKTSVAKILAKAINCEQPQNGSPCCHCAACRRIADGSSLDIMEIDAASNRGIDEIRDLRERVKYAAATEKYKVYIIDEVHMLTQEAFNALLKTLEEPPQNVLFILATTEPHKIPLTVISRCQRFDFKRIPQQSIYERLCFVAEQEDIRADEKALKLIARKAQGGLRDALGLLDQCRSFADGVITTGTIAAVLGTVDEDFTAELCGALLNSDTEKALSMMETFTASGKDIRQFLYDLNDYLREQLQTNLNDKDKAPRLLNMLSILSDTEGRLRYSMQPQLTLEIALIKACGWQEQPAPQPHRAVREQQAPSPAPKPRTEAPPPSPQAEAAPAPKPQPAPKQKPKAANEAEPPTSEAARMPQTVTLSLQRVQSEWRELLDAVRERSITVNAFLQHASPAALENNVLTLDFVKDYAVHMNNIVGKPNNKQILESCLKQRFGHELKVQGRLTEAEEDENGFIPSDEEESLFD